MAPEIFGFSTPNIGNAQHWQCNNASTVQWNVQSLLSKVSTESDFGHSGFGLIFGVFLFFIFFLSLSSC